MHNGHTLLDHPFFSQACPLPINLRPSLPIKTQQECNRLQQSCAELQTGQRSQTERPIRLSRLARFCRVYPKSLNCWKIVEGTEPEPTSDIKDEDIFLGAIDLFGGFRNRWCSGPTVDPSHPWTHGWPACHFSTSTDGPGHPWILLFLDIHGWPGFHA